MQNSIIEFAKVNKWYGTQQVLRDIDLEIQPNSVMVICGPSGSGKSTLLRCVNGLETAQSGMIRVMGEELNRGCLRRSDFRVNIGMVFQRFSLYPHMRVIDNVTLALRKVRGIKRCEAEDKAHVMLERVGVAHKARSYPGELSGGQQQRVAIARALVLEPRIMLFDEPTSALDPEMIREVLDVIRQLPDLGMTLLLVTHEMGFAKEAATEVVFMDNGAVVEHNCSQTFFSNPKTSRAQQFLDQVLHH